MKGETTAGERESGVSERHQAAVDELVQAVRSTARYQHIAPGLIRRIGSRELEKGRGWKDTLKATKNKLHQVGGAYFSTPPAYQRWLQQLEEAAARVPDPSFIHPVDHPGAEDRAAVSFSRLQDSSLAEGCLDIMRQHASTRERLPILETFFHRTLEAIAPVHSVLDLACGLNPLALPWMPLAPGFTYLACDVYADLAAFLNGFFTLLGVDGQAQVCDLIDQVPQEPVQLALLLKSIPCLEQVDRQVGLRILEEVRAEHILVSFPAHSLGGRNKGMPENYSRSFRDLLAGKDWQVREFSFPTEVAFLVTRGPGHRGAA